MLTNPVAPIRPPRRIRLPELLALCAILLGGALLRWSYLCEVRHGPDFALPQLDAAFHDYWASGLATGDWTPPANRPDPLIRSTPYFRPPGYPYFLALIYRLAGPGYLAPRIVQMGLGLASVVLVFLLGRRVFGPPVGLIGAALLSGYWVFAYFEAEFLEPALLVLLVLALMHVLVTWTRRITWPRALLAGLLLGLGALVRPNILLFGLAVLCWAAWLACRQGQKRRFAVAWIGLGLGTALAVAPATLRNYLVARDFVLISANGGINLYTGNNSETTGGWVSFPELQQMVGLLEWDCFDYPQIVRAVERAEGRSLRYSEVSAHFRDRALAYIRRHPGRALELTLHKAIGFWGPVEVANNKVVECDRAHSATLRYNLTFPMVFAAALVGIALWIIDSRSRRPGQRDAGPAGPEIPILLVLFMLSYWASIVPFFLASRYRVPVTPFLLLFAAYALYRMWRLGRARDLRGVAGWAIVGAGLYMVEQYTVAEYEPDEVRWHFQRGSAYQLQGQLSPAIDEYTKALQLDPANLKAHFNLGFALLGAGKADLAAAHFAEALRAQPDFRPAHIHLAEALARTNRTAEAITHYRAALRLQPADADTHCRLGDLLARQGRTAEAIREYQEALRIDPGHGGACAGLSTPASRPAGP